MTTKEMLQIVYKNEKYFSNSKWREAEDEILKLEKCKDIRIGNPQRKGISGGEKKRVSIGIEIVSNPSILFLLLIKSFHSI